MPNACKSVFYLGAAVAHEQHVEALDIAVDDADHGVVQVLHGRRYLAHRPHALLRGRRGLAAQPVVPISTGHPLHDDEGVGGVEAGGDDYYAVLVAHL